MKAVIIYGTLHYFPPSQVAHSCNRARCIARLCESVEYGFNSRTWCTLWKQERCVRELHNILDLTCLEFGRYGAICIDSPLQVSTFPACVTQCHGINIWRDKKSTGGVAIVSGDGGKATCSVINLQDSPRQGVRLVVASARKSADIHYVIVIVTMTVGMRQA
jgi:hypothetical protein